MAHSRDERGAGSKMPRTTTTAAGAWTVPTRTAAAWYWLRVGFNVLKRGLRDLFRPSLRRHACSNELRDAPVLAERRSALWRDGRDDEHALVAGKVHNLRIARIAFDGIVVRRGSTLSFWRQLGRPGRWRGFVEGREVREGCVVPTIAGGLCQLSNALASCAVAAGATLVERHGHTARAEPGPAGEGPPVVDATVFWNYVDLRIAADFDVRIEVELSADELIVRMRGARAAGHALRAAIPIEPAAARQPVARGCLTCDELTCFRHKERSATQVAGSTAILVNAWTPEFARHLGRDTAPADWFLPWVRPARRAAGTWLPTGDGARHVACAASMRRMLLLRSQAGEQGGRQAAVLRGDAAIATAHARRLQAWHTHLVVDQSLLASLVRNGALGGRSYDVLVHALPAGELQRRLDAAARHWPQAPSLRDFRVDDAHCEAELRGLDGARRLVTPHAEVARHLRATCDAPVETVDWILPAREERLPRERGEVPVVVFAASALARKGAQEMAQALRRLGWRLLVLGTPSRDAALWRGIEVEHVGYRSAWLARADVVALPAFIEHSPRALLAALARGIPVVATRECGLPSSPGVIEVAAGDVPALVAALELAISAGRA